MRIERISDNKIKVEINSEDIRVWNVNIKNLTENTPEAQNLFKHALKQAEEKLDFCIGTSHLMVEVVPLAKDGFVMIISKVNSKPDISNFINIKSTVVKLKKNTDKTVSMGVYKFLTFDDLCSGVEEIYDLFFGKSTVYKYKDCFYLMLIPSDLFGFYETDNKLSEFSEKIDNPIASIGLLSEYGEIFIQDDAVDILTSYFS
mgnify:CR=1 FL=1